MKNEVQIIWSNDIASGGPFFIYHSGAGAKNRIEVHVEFQERKNLNASSDLLAKAIGHKEHLKKTGQQLQVIDATAGLCRDSFHLACLGCRVVALEKNKKIFEVVNFYVAQLPENLKFQLIYINALSYLDSLQEVDRPDIVYLDPMFPEKKKTAKSGKETELLKRLEGPPSIEDESVLLLSALKVARKRVVVKRPIHAPVLKVLLDKKIKPRVQFKGRSVRYDVYIGDSLRTVS